MCRWDTIDMGSTEVYKKQKYAKKKIIKIKKKIGMVSVADETVHLRMSPLIGGLNRRQEAWRPSPHAC